MPTIYTCMLAKKVGAGMCPLCPPGSYAYEVGSLPLANNSLSTVETCPFHVKMASTSRPEEPDGNASVPQPGSSSSVTTEPEASADIDTSSTSSESDFLQSLCQPISSDFAQKRQLLRNPLPAGERKSCGHGDFDRLSVFPSQRVKEFPRS